MQLEQSLCQEEHQALTKLEVFESGLWDTQMQVAGKSGEGMRSA